MRKDDLSVGKELWAVLGSVVEHVRVVSFDDDTVCLLLTKSEKLVFGSYKGPLLFVSEPEARKCLAVR